MKDNKLIAEFMGVKPTKSELGRKVYYDSHEDKYVGLDLQYDTSWDWLMPVVDKIEDMGCEIVTTNGKCTISGANDYYGESIGKSRRGATYDAIVEFINQYNKK